MPFSAIAENDDSIENQVSQILMTDNELADDMVPASHTWLKFMLPSLLCTGITLLHVQIPTKNLDYGLFG